MESSPGTEELGKWIRPAVAGPSAGQDRPCPGGLGRSRASLSRQGQADGLPVPQRRTLPRGHLRPQAHARQVRRADRPRKHEAGKRQGHPDEIALSIPAARPERTRSQRDLSPAGPLDRRLLRHSFHARRQLGSRHKPAADEQRSPDRRPSLHGILDDLWFGQRQPQPARIYRALSRPAPSWEPSCGPRGSFRPSTRGLTCATGTSWTRPSSFTTSRGPGPATRSSAANSISCPDSTGWTCPGKERAPNWEASIQSMELAFRMQTEALDAFDVRKESQTTLERYGDGYFSRGCLMARRLLERGVRVVQVFFGNRNPLGQPRQHLRPTRPGGSFRRAHRFPDRRSQDAGTAGGHHRHGGWRVRQNADPGRGLLRPGAQQPGLFIPCWPAGVSGGVWPTAPPTTSVSPRPRNRSTSTISTPPCCISSAWITPS